MDTRAHSAYVLVVDDQQEDLDLIRAVLEPAGFRVATAESCREARRRLREGSYEVLIVDLQLPDGDGLDLLTLAREKDPHTVALVLTAHASTETAVAALRRGAYNYLSKPCPAELLLAAVKRAAERQRLESSLAERNAELAGINQDLDRRVQDATRHIFFLNERLKRFVVQLMETNEAQVRFMENVVHELKNPLFVVSGYATFLLSKPPAEWDHNDVRTALLAIERNSGSLHALLEELMEATRISGHKIELRRESVDSRQEASEAVESYRPQALAKGVSISIEGTEGLRIDADRNRLRQVLSNLLSNAIKFTPAGGSVTVSVRQEGTSARFSVRDSGVGIPQADLTRIFERFYQADPGRLQKGLGLGLEITKGLVQLHGGRIWAESEPGRGATFHFTIPRPAAEETQQARESLGEMEPEARVGASANRATV